MADLNRGGAATSGLRKVDSSQMTHKNPSLRSASIVPDNGKKGPPLKPKPGAKPAKKPAKVELEDGNKWIIVRLFFLAFHNLVLWLTYNRKTKRTIGLLKLTTLNFTTLFTSLVASTLWFRSPAKSTL